LTVTPLKVTPRGGAGAVCDIGHFLMIAVLTTAYCPVAFVVFAAPGRTAWQIADPVIEVIEGH
jgi:hypothetical protein